MATVCPDDSCPLSMIAEEAGSDAERSKSLESIPETSSHRLSAAIVILHPLSAAIVVL